MSNWFHAHAHSHFSTLDGMTSVESMVQRAVRYKQPALALTDHGLMSGVVQLYTECKKAGIKPFPGIEAYLIDPLMDEWEDPPKGKKVGRYHVILLALSERGYKGLVKFTSLTHTRPRFNRFPRATLGDLNELAREYGDDIALLTGCFFGWLQQTLVNYGYDDALKVARMYKAMFKHTFVELQHHNIDHVGDATNTYDYATDDQIVEALLQIADELDLPVVATQDAHYTDQSQKHAHAMMKRMTYGGTDDEFPGDSFHLASTDWVAEHYSEDAWGRIEEGMGELLKLNRVQITPLDEYKIDLPAMPEIKHPMMHLRRVCQAQLKTMFKTDPYAADNQPVYRERLNYELDIIAQLGMPEYFNIWEDFARWCRDQKIAIEARGSGNGSLVNYLIGVTQVDPVRWGCIVERFISPDRIKAPDVDMDIEDSERWRALQYVMTKYDAVQIGTYSKLGVTMNDEGEERGNVFVSWQAWKRREAEQIALRKYEAGGLARKGDVKAYAGGVFNKQFGHIKDINGVRSYSRWEYEGLRKIDAIGSVYRSYGVHAGGVLLGGKNTKIEEYIPTMLVASSNTTVSQYDMDDVEKFGILKMDILGQVSLSWMRRAMEMINSKVDPTDFTWIPDDDPMATQLLREGRTNTGIFHYEGWTKSKGGKELKIKTTMDAILGQALYMPGCMDVAPGMSISQKDLYIMRRRNPKARKEVEYLHPAFESELSETFGAVVFQEQVINIMRNLGMDIAGINNFFAVVKDSGRGAHERNAKRMAQVRDQFDRLCKRAKIDPDEAWMQTASFVSYGFNRAHATGYGIRSYRTAYLKAHYPLETMTGLLQAWAGTQKERIYIAEARRVGIRILPPDVNVSGLTWTRDLQRKGVRKGLVSIAGIGDAIAQPIAENAPYSSLEEMIESLPARVMAGGKQYLADGTYSGTIAKLRDAGALRCFGIE